ncbi:adenosylmethionine decarboxylase [Chitinilyticum aquatile]|uniref:adenosylmethionine decarboxylase n=1 Tax=Chitinilyticum aquatile TaxID=362520 RepID=UPI000425A6C9|nr:adenosylmethionine decarboxylase [Chitinilyticum aquatile]
MASPLGRHLLADFYGCDAALLANPERIASLLLAAAGAGRATVLQQHFHHFGPQQGVTGVLLLMESHISIHTWPEHGYAALDLFMCGQAESDAALASLCDSLQPASRQVQRVLRGGDPGLSLQSERA